MFARFRNHLTRFASETSGFTLIEMLVAAAMLPIVLLAVFLPLDTAGRTQRRDYEWAFAVQEGRTGLAALVHELRQATSVIAMTPNSVEFQVTLNGTDQHVLWQCDVPQPSTTYRECIRVQSAAGVALPALTAGRVTVQRLLNGTVADPVFPSYLPDPIAPTFATVQFKLPASGSLTYDALHHTIVLRDGAYMRNLDLGA